MKTIRCRKTTLVHYETVKTPEACLILALWGNPCTLGGHWISMKQSVFDRYLKGHES